jgi:tetratricopeptide (TPR) repeat protein
VLRGRKQFAECADVYSKGIDIIRKPEKSNWVIHYFRGICFERAKQWPKAEADLKMSLDLFPDQPHVLNYLGYSWIDQGINVDEGMRMIKRAVEQRADDGYIVDSLGWAYYRLGNMEEAVKHLERAIELKPDDPTITCCWAGAVSLLMTPSHLPFPARAYGFSRSGAFSTRLARSFMSGGACTFITRSGMVLYCSRQVAIIQRFSLACPGHKPVCVRNIGFCSIDDEGRQGQAVR